MFHLNLIEKMDLPKNMNVPEDEQESFSQDLFGNNVYEAAPRYKKIFLPWHRPRKQFVRHKQWCEQIKLLIQETLPDNKVIKYLGLPGDDLLDLKYFHREICVPNGLGLRYLGFNNSAEATSPQNVELNISRDELNKMQYIDPRSDVIPDNICQIANKKSMAWQRSFAMCPFDIINIDLCDGFAKDPPAKFLHSHYEALSQLLTFQKTQKQPWLFFLTTRTSKGDIQQEVFNKLKQLYNQNLKDCPSFFEKSKDHFSIIDEDSLNNAIETEKGISDVFLISLCKWISGMLLSQIPPSKISLKSVIGYKVAKEASNPDLMSIALKVEPNFTPTADSLGLTVPKTSILNECDIASGIVNRVFKQVDADSILNDNIELMNEMIEMSMQLLKEARYDVSGYKDWVRNF